MLDAGGSITPHALALQAGKTHQAAYDYFSRDERRWDWILEQLGVKPEHRVTAYQRALRTGLRKSSIPHLEFCAKLAGWITPHSTTINSTGTTVIGNQQNNTVQMTQVIIQHDAPPADLAINSDVA